MAGPENFIQYASEITSSLQDLYDQPGPHAVFIHHLMFAVQYAHFHQCLAKGEFPNAASTLLAMFHEDIVPKTWWAVLLCDMVDLLQSCKSNVISSPGADGDHLDRQVRHCCYLPGELAKFSGGWKRSRSEPAKGLVTTTSVFCGKSKRAAETTTLWNGSKQLAYFRHAILQDVLSRASAESGL